MKPRGWDGGHLGRRDPRRRLPKGAEPAAERAEDARVTLFGCC